MEANLIVGMIANALAPYVGQMMAKASIESHCKRLGLDITKLDRIGLDRLLHQLGLGLNIFIGREKSESVMSEVRLMVGV